jgi:hypothetical protein
MSNDITGDQRDDRSRRGFLALAGAGAAGVAAAAALGPGTAEAESTAVPKAATKPLVAYVRNARTGEVAVLEGEREVVVHDRALAARIARAAHRTK